MGVGSRTKNVILKGLKNPKREKRLLDEEDTKE